MFKNRVTIFVWDPEKTKAIKDKDRAIGHVAIRTHTGGSAGEGYHMSLYPQGSVAKNRIFDKKPPKFVESLAHDLRIHGKKPPSRVYDIFTLDVSKINETYENAKNGNAINFSLAGSGIARREEARNCAGFAGYLLGIGGIQKIIGYTHRRSDTQGLIANAVSRADGRNKVEAGFAFLSSIGLVGATSYMLMGVSGTVATLGGAGVVGMAVIVLFQLNIARLLLKEGVGYMQSASAAVLVGPGDIGDMAKHVTEREKSRISSDDRNRAKESYDADLRQALGHSTKTEPSMKIRSFRTG